MAPRRIHARALSSTQNIRITLKRTILCKSPHVRSCTQIITPTGGRSVIDDADDGRARDGDDDRAREVEDDRSCVLARGRGSICAARATATARGDADLSIARSNCRPVAGGERAPRARETSRGRARDRVDARERSK